MPTPATTAGLSARPYRDGEVGESGIQSTKPDLVVSLSVATIEKLSLVYYLRLTED